MKTAHTLLFASHLSIAMGSAVAQSPPKEVFSFTPIKIDSSREARPTDWYLQGRSENNVKDSLASYMAVDPAYLYFDKSAKPIARRQGEGTQYTARLPSGYVYCGTRVRLTSAFPNEGPRAAQFSVQATPQGVEIATWTPTSALGSGRSWIEADVQLIGVRQEFLQTFVDKGICGSTKGSDILSCKGGVCSGAEHGRFESIGREVLSLRRSPSP